MSNKVLSEDEKKLLKILELSLSNNDGTAAVSDITEEIYDIAAAHSVVSLLFPVAELSDESESGIVERIKKETEKITLQSYRLLFETKRICSALEKKGLTVAVLKGAAASSFYPVPEYRKSGDIDILLCDPKKKNMAIDAMVSIGFKLSTYQPALHQIIFDGPGGVETELHVILAEPFDNKKINLYMESLLSDIADHIEEKEIMGIDVPILDDDYQAFELLLHMLQHFLRKGFGLKLLCDWVVYWNHTLSDGNEEKCRRYRQLVSESGLSSFSDMITGVCAYYLGLRHDIARTIYIGGRKENVKRSSAALFLREVFDGGEFGENEKNRMVMLRSNDLFSYIREFHHQMHLNFPRAGNIIPIWPALWLYTLIRFFYNNATIRKTSAISIIKKSGDRSRLMKMIELWK